MLCLKSTPSQNNLALLEIFLRLLVKIIIKIKECPNDRLNFFYTYVLNMYVHW